MIRLIKPTLEHKEQMLQFIEEFKKEGKKINGSAGLDTMPYEDWLIELKNNEDENTVKSGVTRTTFIAVNEVNEVIGTVDIRHYLDDFYENFGGHIGYSVKKSKRNRGYATKMLELGLTEFKKISDTPCLVTCDRDNLASASVIKKNGGILENELTMDNGIIRQRYWIKTVEK